VTIETVPLCRTCEKPLQRDIIFGGLRYYVCRGCGCWAVPYPPDHDTHFRVRSESNE